VVSVPYTRKEVIGDCGLYLGDCLQIMPTLGKVDAVVADPPYDIGYIPRGNSSVGSMANRNWGPKDKLVGDTGGLNYDPRPFLGIADEQLWWGANHYADKLPNSRGWLVWFKARDMLNTKFSHVEMAWTNIDQAVEALDHRWMGMIRDSEQHANSDHPTKKPLAVMIWCLGFIHGRIVLDPYMGSGTTGVVCVEIGKSFIGIEIKERHFDKACERISRAERQEDLFRKPVGIQSDVFDVR